MTEDEPDTNSFAPDDGRRSKVEGLKVPSPDLRPWTFGPLDLWARHRDAATLLAVILLGAGVRLWFVLTPGLGHRPDIDLFVKWIRALSAHGLGGFYEAVSFCNYTPLGVLVFGAVGKVASLFDPALANGDLLRALLKVPACFADVGLALLLFVEGRRLLGGGRAVAAAALYFLNPVSIYNSAYWGQVDAIHSALVLLALILVNRRRFGPAGAGIALAMLAKLQSIAFLPLIVFEVYRLGRGRAMRSMFVGGLALSVWVCVPFAWAGALDDVFEQGYGRAVGTYTDLSRNAYNVWYLFGSPTASDTSIPLPIARAVANGRDRFAEDASWMLLLTFRTISLIAYGLCVVVILSLYSLRPGSVARFGAAGLLGLAFFLIPTEMHERYALPAVAVLALWAAAGPWQERLFVLLSAMMLLNLAAVESPAEFAPQIAGVNVALFVVLLGWVLLPRARCPVDAVEPPADRPTPPGPDVRPSNVIRWFRRATVVALVTAGVLTGWIATIVADASPVVVPDGTLYLSSLAPVRQSQAWGKLGRNVSVARGLIHLGDMYYLRGLGTHARSRLVYEIPEGYDTFEAVVGIDREARGAGSVTVAVRVDDEERFASGRITGRSDPIPVRVSVAGARTLTLRADPTADGRKADHVDWAAARFVRTEP